MVAVVGAAPGSLASTAETTSRCLALKRGLQVVRVSRASGVGSSTSIWFGRTTERPVDLVAELALAGGDEDLVADLELVEPVEGGAVGGAVAGDGGVAGLARQRRVGVVARALLEVGHAHALDHRLVDADPRDADEGDGLALAASAAAPAAWSAVVVIGRGRRSATVVVGGGAVVVVSERARSRT